MSDFRSLNNFNSRLSNLTIDSYTFRHDPKTGKFKVSINWECLDANVRVFRIFKAKVGADLLKKDYKVDEVALSRLTQNKSFAVENKILYDKNFFTKNRSVDLKTDSNIYSQLYKDSSTLNYFHVHSVRSNSFRKYSFVDENVKFGESYFYQIVGIMNDFRQTPTTKPVLVTCELTENCDPPEILNLKVITEGILFTIGNPKQGSKIKGYEIYKFNNKTNKYEFLFFVEKKAIEDFVCFIDSPEEVGQLIKYKVFSIDLFGNRSLNSKKTSIVFDTIFEKKRQTQIPKARIFRDENVTKIRVYKSENSSFFNVKRKDLWLNEKQYSFKSKNGIFWDGSIFLNEEYFDFVDSTAFENKDYQYKISFFEKTGEEGAFFESPSLTISKDLNYFSFDESLEKEKTQIKLVDFSFFVRDKKRSPALVSFSFRHEPSEEDLVYKLSFPDKDIVIDPLNDNVVLELEKNKEHKFDFFIMSAEDGQILIERKGNNIKL